MATRKSPTKRLRSTPLARSQTSKLDRMQELLRRPEGATVDQISKALVWQPHSVRGAFAGSIKKRGLKIVSTKKDGEQRVYRIEG